MNTRRTKRTITPGSDEVEYRELVSAFPPRPIRDDKQLAQTWAKIEALLAKATRSKAEDDYLVVLSDLVEHWEEDHVDLPRPNFASRSVIEGIIREAPLDDKFGDDIDAALGDRIDAL